MDHVQYELVPTALAVTAMRDSGYRNTAYAIAELIDNAIQARATSVELLCYEQQHFVNQRKRRNIHKIAVLDNGTGMDAHVLSSALQFGNGQYLNDRSGIGRFGMGLPSSSISQCRSVQVWTWQQGPDSALYSYIDLTQVEQGIQTDVPTPVRGTIPPVWRETGDAYGETGTLVVWSELDRCLWKTGSTIIRNSEHLVGRMYRRFILEGKARIRMASFVDEPSIQYGENRFAEVNDPVYLMVPSSTPEPYSDESMFREDGDNWAVDTTIEHLGANHTVTTRFTVAKEQARNRQNAGNTPYGKHAKRNVGISLMRAERELELDVSLVNQYDPRERWWGVEMEFPPVLDEIFGVTNNKQTARHFTEIAIALDETLSGTERIADLKEQLYEDNDPRGAIIEVVHLIQRRLRSLRKVIEIQTRGMKKSRRYDSSRAEIHGTDVTRTRQYEGHKGASDQEEGLPADERTEVLARELLDTGLSPEQAHKLAARAIDQGIKYTFADADLEGRNFFTVKPVAGEIVIKLNVNHPAYEHLVEVLEESPEGDVDVDEIFQRLRRANRGLKLLLMAWARFEDEAYPDTRRQDIQDLRYQWGQYASQFLKDER